MFYIGAAKGYIVGYLAGRKSARLFLQLMKKHKALENIPTRELRKMGDSGEMMIARQRLKIAALVLQYLVTKYTDTELINTMFNTACYLQFKELDTAGRLEAISKSHAVVQALAFYAADVDKLDVDKLVAALKEKGKEHVWHNLSDNASLTVGEEDTK